MKVSRSTLALLLAVVAASATSAGTASPPPPTEVATSTPVHAPVDTVRAEVREEQPAEARTVDVRVLQYNIHYAHGGLEQIAQDVERTGADVVLLNEVDTHVRGRRIHQGRWLARRLGMRLAYDANITFRWGRRGNAVLSRLAVGEVDRFDLHVPEGTRPRGLMRVRLGAGPVRFDVWTTHLNAGAGTFAQAEGVRDRVGEPRCATIVGGDLNARPGMRADRAVGTHLDDVWPVVGRGPGPTNFHATKRIDYLFTDQAEPRAAWVTPLRHSDHRGVVGDVRIDSRQGC